MRAAGLSRLVIAGLCLGIWWPVPADARPVPDETVQTLAQRMDDRIPQRLAAYGVAGVALAVIRRGEIVWIRAYGVADAQAGRAMRIDDIFRVESISKSVTAWGVMTLVERGQVDLDMPLAAYVESWSFPQSGFAANTITIRQLLSHTAGLPLGDFSARYPPRGPVPDLRDSLRREARPIREPGSGFSYSNTGFNLLELLIEDVSGMRFSDYMAQEILAPLGMTDATFDWNADIGGRIATAYDLKARPVAPYVYPGRGSGGLFASLRDIARFVQAGMAQPYRPQTGVLSPAGLERIFTPQTRPGGLLGLVADAYAMGVFLEHPRTGGRIVWNGGQGAGWMALFHFAPGTGDGIVILSNSQRAWPLFARTLRDWSRWAGVAPAGMARLAGLILAIQVLTGLVILVSAGQVWRIRRGVVARTRRFAPLANTARAVRLFQGAAAGFLLWMLIWERSRDYSFLWSILPHAIGWFEFAILAAAASFALTALFPRRADTRRRPAQPG